MSTSLEKEIASIGGITKFKVEGKTVQEFIREVVKDSLAQIKKSGKLTWTKGALNEVPDPSFLVGKLRKDKTWIGPIGRGKYYIQNMRVFLSNGKVLNSLASISDDDIVEQVQQRGGGFITMKFPSDLARVKEALEIYAKLAVEMDPNLCPYCFQFSDKDRKKMTAHVFSRHPKEFNREMAENTETPEEDETTAAPEAQAAAVGE